MTALPAALPSGINYSGSVTRAFDSLATFVPKLIGFLVILLIGVIIAKVLLKVVRVALGKVGFNRAVERGGIGSALARSSYQPSDIVAKFVYYAVLLFTMQAAFGVFGPNPISTLLRSVIAFLPKAVVAVVLVVVASAIAKATKTFISEALGGLSYGKLLGDVAAGAILFFGVIAALNQIDVATAITTPIEIAVLAAIAGVVIVGVGGGLIRPMQARWENTLQKLSDELPTVRQHAQQAQARKQQATALRGPGLTPAADPAYPLDPVTGQPAAQTQVLRTAPPRPAPRPRT